MHHYKVVVEWTGNKGSGTLQYHAYSRDHIVRCDNKVPIQGSSDPAFLGDPNRWNPEELLIASVSACHKLWYLHLCAVNGVVVLSYNDEVTGIMVDGSDDSVGRFLEIELHPRIEITDVSDIDLAIKLHNDAHHQCFIANSLNFPVRCKPMISKSC
jgi:organic hydroperoxide reductase OsmC/OhrA